MKQGVLVNHRVQLLMSPGDQGFRGFGRKTGERRRKSVRGCIIGQDISVLNLVIVKKGAPLPVLVTSCLTALWQPMCASQSGPASLVAAEG